MKEFWHHSVSRGDKLSETNLFFEIHQWDQRPTNFPHWTNCLNGRIFLYPAFWNEILVNQKQRIRLTALNSDKFQRFLRISKIFLPQFHTWNLPFRCAITSQVDTFETSHRIHFHSLTHASPQTNFISFDAPFFPAMKKINLTKRSTTCLPAFPRYNPHRIQLEVWDTSSG